MSVEESGLLDDVGAVGQLNDLHRELRRLRLAAGQPGLRVIAQKTGWSRATVGRVFTREPAPKWDVLSAVVRHLGGDAEEFRLLWMRCMEQSAPEAKTSVPVPDEPSPAAAGIAALLLADALFDYFAWWRPESPIPYGADIGYVVFPLAMIAAASLALERR